MFLYIFVNVLLILRFSNSTIYSRDVDPMLVYCHIKPTVVSAGTCDVVCGLSTCHVAILGTSEGQSDDEDSDSDYSEGEDGETREERDERLARELKIQKGKTLGVFMVSRPRTFSANTIR